ncbi:ABC transporter permease [Desulfuromonas versatilis]|uniref:ABC transporter permease n=1 Tax=Desulfuromonas versatilis TaxID=2802975 RepID=A0ABM8HML3_9BACT|nr:ABC transporter permease [Desulfuromonas versatilis]BCR03557.1 ABC transporter permease [Desulfuromonas versatilis]
MTLSKLVMRNISSRRGRFVFTLLGIGIGIASFVTFLSLGGSLKSEIQRESAALGANLVVTPKGSCAYEQVSILTGEQLPNTITGEEVEQIRAIEGVTAIPFLSERTALDNRPVSVMGILPAETLAFKRWEIGQGSYFADGDQDGLVVGAVAAEQFKLQPGSQVRVRGEEQTVRGVLKETGGKDDVTLFLPLPLAQRLYATKGTVSYVAVRVADLDRLELYAQQINEATSLGVITDKQMLKSVLSIVGTVNVTLQLIAAVAVLAAAFGIINTMMTATYERKREIGILQALGARRRTIFSIFLLESGLYGLLGGVAGVVGGLLFSVLAAPQISSNHFTAFVKGSGSSGLVSPSIVLGSIAFSAVVAIVAGLYPAWRAAQLSPVEAISYE